MAAQVIAAHVGRGVQTEIKPLVARIARTASQGMGSFVQTLAGFWRCLDAGITLQRMMNSRNGRQLSPKDRAEIQDIVLERLADS